MKAKLVFLLGLLTANSASLAINSDSYLNHIEISLGAGPSWLTANDGTMAVSAQEADKADVNNVTSTALQKIGVGYYLFSQQLAQRSFLNGLLMELNLYRISGSINGNVWSFGDSTQNNFTFHAPFSNKRLMLDVKPRLFTTYGISAYPIMGMGMAWNRLSYADQANAENAGAGNVSLNAATNRRIAYDLGFGTSYQATKNLNISAEYINNRLGNFSPSKTSQTEIVPLTVPNFLVHSQNLLFNVSYSF